VPTKVNFCRRKLGQNQRKKFIYVGFSLTSVGLWPAEVSIITVVTFQNLKFWGVTATPYLVGYAGRRHVAFAFICI
jgi:hypothetical protein